MGDKRKVIIIVVAVLFFIVFRLLTQTSASEEIYAVRHVSQEGTNYIEVFTNKDTDHLVLQALDEGGATTHFFTMENYLSKNYVTTKKNIFLITHKTHGLDAIDELILVSSGNINIPIETQEKSESEGVLEAMVYTTEEEKEDKVEMLKIMSYNIHHGRDLYGRYSLDKIAQVIKESGADIIGIQEAEKGVIRSRFKDQMKYLSDELSMYYVYGDNIGLLGGKYGNGILSRYPIEGYENLHIPSGREQRGLLSAVINVNGNKINFLTTHLGLNKQERIKQVNAIHKYLDTLPYPIILVGDFNVRPDNEIIEGISKRLIDTAYATDKGDQPTFNLPILSGRIDYIFTDKYFTIKDYEVIKSRASDHYPVITTIAIP